MAEAATKTDPADTQISSLEVSKAWENWLNFHHGINCEETEHRFFKYLHSFEQSFVDECIDWGGFCDGDVTFLVAASTAHNVRMIAGPDYYAVIRAYYINHPWQKDNA